MERCLAPIYQAAFSNQHLNKRQLFPLFELKFGFYLVNSTISWVSGCLEHSIPMGSWVCITNRNMGKYEFVSPVIVWEGIINAVPMIFFRSSPRCPRPCCRPPYPRQPSPRPPTRQSSPHPTTLRLQGTRLKRFHH